jgi:Holliday junction resolvase
MSGASSRTKGAAFEREICKLLRDELGGDYSRNLRQYQKKEEGDIEQLVGPYLIECKHHANLSEKAWWRQASIAAKSKGAVPCVAYKFKGRILFRVPSHDAALAQSPWSLDFEYSVAMERCAFLLHVRELA